MSNLFGKAVFVLFLSVPVLINAQSELKSKESLLKAIKETADCAAFVLLDQSGKSRCDYNLVEGKWYDYEPPWHTGQLIYGLVEAYKITGNKKYLQRAEKAGDWWCSLQVKDHPKLKGMLNAIHGDGIDNIVFATITDGTGGLFKLYDITHKKIYADVPTSAGEWMLNNMYEPEHKVFYDNVNPVTGDVMKSYSPFWPEKKEQTLNDVARPNNEGSLYRDMFLYTKNEKYKKIFIELCESLVEKQDENGLWMQYMPNSIKDGTFHPRFNLWYAESLIDGYVLTGGKFFLDAAVKTLRTYQKAMLKDGTFYYVNYLDGKYNENSVTGSATAFSGILWIRLLKLGAGDEFAQSLEKAADWIIKNRFSVDHPDKNLRGAVIDTRTRRKKGNIWITQRDVGTSFGLRFLSDYFNYKYGKN
jgi:rhamnogalacturonyl hydrolase YesR